MNDSTRHKSMDIPRSRTNTCSRQDRSWAGLTIRQHAAIQMRPGLLLTMATEMTPGNIAADAVQTPMPCSTH